MNVRQITETLDNAIRNYRSEKNATQRLRDTLKELGINHVPFGVGNSKTDLPGFYRKVGDTCPHDCPYLGKGCYSQGGRTKLQQVRASCDHDATVAAFVASVVLCQKFRKGWPARMFVSGDVYRDNEVDRGLVERLKEAAAVLQEYFGADLVGYGYTHSHDKALTAEFSEAGMEILESDYFGAGGTIVWPHDKLSLLKPKGFKLVKCPSQTSDHKVKCSTCRLCKEARERKLCIVFHPHGVDKAKLQLQTSMYNC